MNTGSKSNKNKNKAKRKGNKKNGSKKSVSRPIDVVTERSDNENNVEV